MGLIVLALVIIRCIFLVLVEMSPKRVTLVIGVTVDDNFKVTGVGVGERFCVTGASVIALFGVAVLGLAVDVVLAANFVVAFWLGGDFDGKVVGWILEVINFSDEENDDPRKVTVFVEGCDGVGIFVDVEIEEIMGEDGMVLIPAPNVVVVLALGKKVIDDVIVGLFFLTLLVVCIGDVFAEVLVGVDWNDISVKPIVSGGANVDLCFFVVFTRG